MEIPVTIVVVEDVSDPEPVVIRTIIPVCRFDGIAPIVVIDAVVVLIVEHEQFVIMTRGYSISSKMFCKLLRRKRCVMIADMCSC